MSATRSRPEPGQAQAEQVVAHGRNLARTAQVFEIGALVIAVVGVIAAILVMANGGHDAAGIGLAMLVGAVAVGVTLWAAARALRLFGEYVAVRIGSDRSGSANTPRNAGEPATDL